jgi:hypothetical protein
MSIIRSASSRHRNLRQSLRQTKTATSEPNAPTRVASELALLEHVLQSPRRCHDDVKAVRHDVRLVLHVDASNGQHNSRRRVARIPARVRKGHQLLVRLPRQLPRRAHDHRYRSFATRERQLLLLFEGMHEDGKTEGKRLARSGESHAYQVSPGKGDGYALQLDGGRLGNLALLEVFQNRRQQLHVLEAGNGRRQGIQIFALGKVQQDVVLVAEALVLSRSPSADVGWSLPGGSEGFGVGDAFGEFQGGSELLLGAGRQTEDFRVFLVALLGHRLQCVYTLVRHATPAILAGTDRPLAVSA